jgi:hypothetical protein
MCVPICAVEVVELGDGTHRRETENLNQSNCKVHFRADRFKDCVAEVRFRYHKRDHPDIRDRIAIGHQEIAFLTELTKGIFRESKATMRKAAKQEQKIKAGLKKIDRARNELIGKMNSARETQHDVFEEMVCRLWAPISSQGTNLPTIDSFLQKRQEFKEFKAHGNPQRDLLPEEIKQFRVKVAQWKRKKTSIP